jgi:hypothetical protein
MELLNVTSLEIFQHKVVNGVSIFFNKYLIFILFINFLKIIILIDIDTKDRTVISQKMIIIIIII